MTTSPAPSTAVPAAGRVGLVTHLLLAALDSATAEPGARTVLDCGGGSGTYAVPLARAGYDVTVVELSADALATLRRRADEAGVATLVHPVPGEVERLTELVGSQTYGAVLAHGILDAVDDVGATIAVMAAAVRPGGLLSVLVGNPVASVLGRALAGDAVQALHELRALDDAGTRLTPESVAAHCRGVGLVEVSRHGIGAFSDLVPGAALDSPAARSALADLDLEAAGRAPFADLAARVHLLLRRPTD